jgi:hypothetical protein
VPVDAVGDEAAGPNGWSSQGITGL